MSKPSFQAALRRFTDAQRKYQDFGAYDTEPRAIFADMMERIAQGKPAAVPVPGVGLVGYDDNPWDLYSSMSGYVRANRALTTAARNVALAHNAQAQARVWFKAEYGIEVF